MELIVELTPHTHRVARLDANGAKQYFPDRLWPANGPAFPDVVLLQEDLALAGRLALLYAEKMQTGPLLYPMRQFAALPVEANCLLPGQALPVLQALAVLLKKLITEAEVQFGAKAVRVDLHLQQVQLNVGQLGLIRDWVLLQSFPLRQIQFGNEQIYLKDDKNAENHVIALQQDIGLGFNGQIEEIRWIMEGRRAIDGRKYTGWFPASASGCPASIEFYGRYKAQDPASLLGSLAPPMENSTCAALEWELSYSSAEGLHVQIINWTSGQIHTEVIPVFSPYQKQLLACKASSDKFQSYANGL